MTSVQSRFLLMLDDREVDVTLTPEGSMAILVPMTPRDAPSSGGGKTRTFLDSLTEDGRRVPHICRLSRRFSQEGQNFARGGGGAYWQLSRSR